MRKLFKRLFAAAVLFSSAVCAPAGALESYLYLGYEESGRVYRLTTTDQNQLPTGYVFACEPDVAAFIVDKLRNFRFIKTAQAGDFKKAHGYIYRQVFDDIAEDADRGSGGYAQHQDQRSELIPDSAGKPVFRPAGAPFSAGTGLVVTEGVAAASLEDGECEKVADRKWFRIPNGSWYQTWFNVAGRPESSLKIFYDCWEERDYSCHETIWRGSTPGQVHDRIVAAGVERRFIRAMTDGAMELLDENRQVSELLKQGGFSVFHDSSTGTGEGNLLVHTWAGKDAGRFFVNGESCNDQPAIVSQSTDRRFVAMNTSGTSNRLYVIGNDVLRSWLKGSKYDAPEAECTAAVSTTLESGQKTGIFVYSAPQKIIYCFVKDETLPGNFALKHTITADFAVLAMHADPQGNLYLASIERVPAALEKSDDFAAGFESLQIADEQSLMSSGKLSEDDVKTAMSVKHDLSGSIIFSQAGYAVLYVVGDGQTQPVALGSVFLDKTFFARDFTFRNTSLQDLRVNAVELLKIAEKPGNSLAEVRGNVPGFPDQFRQPAKLFISVRSD